MTKTSQLPEHILDHSQTLTTVATQQALAALTKQAETFSLTGNFGHSGLFSQQAPTAQMSQSLSAWQTADETFAIEQAETETSEQNIASELVDDSSPSSATTNDLGEQHPATDSVSDPIEQDTAEPDIETADQKSDQTIDLKDETKTSFFAGRESLRSQLANKEKYFGELQHRIEELTSNTHNAQDKYEQAKADPRTSTEQLIFLKDEADRSQKELDDVQAISWTVSGEVEQAKSSLEEFERINPQDDSPSQSVQNQETAPVLEATSEQQQADSAEFFPNDTTSQILRNKQLELDQRIQEGADLEIVKGLVKEIEKLKNDVEQRTQARLHDKLKELAAEEKIEQETEVEQSENIGVTNVQAEEEQQELENDNDESQANEREKREQQEKDHLKEKTELEAKQKSEEAERKKQQEEAKETARKAEAALAEQERLRAKQKENGDEPDAFDTLGRGALWVATVPALAQVALFTLSVPAAAAAMIMHAALTADQQTNQRRRRWW